MTDGFELAEASAPSAERRLHERRPVRSLEYIKLGEDNGGIVLNLGLGGLAIQAACGLMDDDLPGIDLQLPQTRRRIKVTGRVVWASESRKTAGVAFLDLTDEDREHIREWIASRNAEGYLLDEQDTAPREKVPHADAASIASTAADEQAPAAPEIAHPASPASSRRGKAPLRVITPAAIPSGTVVARPPAPALSVPAETGHQRQYLLITVVLLVAISLTAAWEAERGTLRPFFARIRAAIHGPNIATSNPTAPPVAVSAAPPDIEIVDARGERWFIPFQSSSANLPPAGNIVLAQRPPRGNLIVPRPANALSYAFQPAARAILDARPKNENEIAAPALAQTERPDALPLPPIPAGALAGGEPARPAPLASATSALVEPPRLMHRVEPEYPTIAARGHIRGTVKLRISIAADGAVKNVTALSGPPVLIQAAVDAVRRWRYAPALLHGQPVPAEEEVSIAFSQQ